MRTRVAHALISRGRGLPRLPALCRLDDLALGVRRVRPAESNCTFNQIAKLENPSSVHEQNGSTLYALVLT
eukprot:6186186-Pleurochrysis_carterae.AAC.1